MIRALALDGGGVRALVQALVCAHIEKESSRACRQIFDLIGGTSAGGILALGLARGICAAELVEWYRKEVGRAFHRSKWYRVKSVNGLREAKYPRDGLESALKDLFGDAVLSECSPCIITSFDLWSGRTAFPGNTGRRANWRVWEAAYATGAAPTYFPPIQLYGGAYIDGGVFANNPSAYVAREAMDRHPREALHLVSIGNQPMSDGEPGTKPGTWGLLEWAKRVVPVFMEAGDDSLAYVTSRSLVDPHRYLRVRPDFGADIPLDDASPEVLRVLEVMAADTIHANRAALAEVWA